MAGENTSPNMNLPVPGVGVTTGPQFAIDLNACLAILDAHDHSAGNGVKVSPAGLNISADLSFLGNNAIRLRTCRFDSQTAVLGAAADLNCLQVVNGDLYYNDGTGNKVRITQSGGVAGSPGSISNLTSPASAAYVSAASTFVWQSASNTAAKMDNGAIKIRTQTVSSKYMELAPPASIAADYTITMPNLPASQKILTLDNTGNMAAPYTVDGTTIKITSNVLGVDGAALTGINGTTGIVAGSITGSTQLGAQTVSQDRLASRPAGTAAGNISLSASSGVSTNGTGGVLQQLSCTLTTTGRPVFVGLVADGTATQAYLKSVSGGSVYHYLYNGATIISSTFQTSIPGVADVNLPPGCVFIIDMSVAGTAGTYTYAYKSQNNSANFVMNYCKLIAYEL